MEKIRRAVSERVSHPVADCHRDLGGALVVLGRIRIALRSDSDLRGRAA